MKVKAQIPNLFTMLNLFSGCVALVFVVGSEPELAFYFVCLGIFFDFFDGFFARKFGVAGPLGVQLDSLADMVTSGVVPGVVMYKLMSNIEQNREFFNLSSDNYFLGVIPFIGFLIPVASAYRLAKFNIDDRQTDKFIGLPTPANALLIVSLPLMLLETGGEGWIFELLNCLLALVVITVLSSYLLISEIHLFSLKMKKISWSESKLQIFFLFFALVMLFIFEFSGIPLIIISYIMLSLVLRKIFKFEF